MKNLKFFVLSAFLFLFVGNVLAFTDSTTTATNPPPELTKEVIYQDVKAALNQLGEALAVGGEHVYLVLVRQQIVSAVTWTIVLLSSLLMLYNFMKAAVNIDERWEEQAPTAIGIVRIGQGIIFGILLIVSLFHIDYIFTGFINPEYGAIKEIMSIIR